MQAFRKYRTVAGAPLETVKELLAGAALFVGNDSGPAHMAAAFGLPVVVVFGASDPLIWATVENAVRSLVLPRGDQRHYRAASHRSARKAARESMKDLLRLLRFVRPYTLALLGSVVLMAIAGGAHAMTAFLVGPIFDRVLNPASPEAQVVLFRIFGEPIYLALPCSGLDPQRLDDGGLRHPDRIPHQRDSPTTSATT